MGQCLCTDPYPWRSTSDDLKEREKRRKTPKEKNPPPPPIPLKVVLWDVQLHEFLQICGTAATICSTIRSDTHSCRITLITSQVCSRNSGTGTSTILNCAMSDALQEKSHNSTISSPTKERAHQQSAPGFVLTPVPAEHLEHINNCS